MSRVVFRSLQLVALLFALTRIRADVLDDWNNAILNSIRTENAHPCVAARALAIVHGAMADTSAAIHRTDPFFQTENVPPGLPLEPALNAAAYCTATNLFPSRLAAFRDLYEKWTRDLEETPRRGESLRLGRSVADAWITWRGNDGSSGSLPYIPRKEPGVWRRTPPFVRPPEMYNWARVTPFTLVSAAQFRPPGPPKLSSDLYADELNELKKLGGVASRARTAEQTEIARFWSDFSYTVTPPGHWNEAAQAVAAARQMPLETKVKLFAALNITMSDVAVACWDSKYVYDFWRPVTAIRAAESDGNPGTEPDPDWIPLLNTPAFPEYVSGHSAFSGAAAIVLAHFNGGDKIRFTISSDSLPGKTRSYESLWTCAEEVSQSRLYGGIHFPTALKDGLKLGQQVAQHALDLFFASKPPALARIFTAPGELHFPPWIGVIAEPGRPLTIETMTAPGQWETWTNAIASAPVARWRLASPRDAAAFRLKAQ
jgi:membrane-associated phospholipid phosphatase